MTADPLTERVRITPDRLALVDPDTDRRWKYGELQEAVESLAVRLPDVGSADRIAIVRETSIRAVLAIHAVLRSGATVVPLDPASAERTLETQLEMVSPAAVIAPTSAEHSIPSPVGVPTVPFDGSDDDQRRVDQQANWTWDDHMVLLFTSGTTGTPKAVPLTMANVFASAAGSALRLGVLPTDNWLCCLPIHHMGGLAPIIRSTLYGTAVTVHQGFSPAAIGEAIEAHDPTGISVVPTQLRRLLEADVPLADLRAVLVGGAPVPNRLIDRCERTGIPVYPTYGLTETASQVTTATPSEAFEHPGTVGRPLWGTTVTITDEAGEPVPEGTIGEIVVDGPTVMPGYANGNDDPFGKHGFHTGDLGYLEDGRLWVTGRSTDVIISGGEQVFPREVSDVIRAHPAVEDAAVVGIEDPEWGERVGALVVAGDGSVDELESYVRERLAAYKVPKTWAFAPDLPRTPSGTIDRDAVRRRLRRVNNPDGP